MLTLAQEVRSLKRKFQGFVKEKLGRIMETLQVGSSFASLGYSIEIVGECDPMSRGDFEHFMFNCAVTAEGGRCGRRQSGEGHANQESDQGNDGTNQNGRARCRSVLSVSSLTRPWRSVRCRAMMGRIDSGRARP